MKGIQIIPIVAMILGVAGCASRPSVALAPVGPNPHGNATTMTDGQLQVFSALQRIDEGDNLGWYQHTDYEIFRGGKRFEHVFNSVGHYASKPRVVTLPPGIYVVQAEGRESLRVKVPVKIESGRISRIHLDDHWNLPGGTPKSELVSMPSGNPVGWREIQ